MAFVVNDRVKETTTSTGTGTINLAGAATGFETFVAGIGNSNTTYYCIQAQGGSAFEIGVGTVTDASPDTLSRTAIISSSNGDAAVDFGAGTKDVFCTLPASKAVIEDNSTNANITGNLTLGGTVDGVDIAARDAVLTSTTTTANAALPTTGGAMTGAITTNSTFDGVDVGARDAVLTSTTTTANAALPKAGGQMSGNITMAGTETVDGRDLSVDGTKLDGIATGATAVGGANGVDFNDDVKARFGTGNDLEIFHDDTGSDKMDKIVSTADFLRIQSDTLRINSANGSQSFIGADLNGSVDLKFQDNIKLSTSSGGIVVAGTIGGDVVSAHPAETTFASDDLIAVYDTSASAIKKGTIANVALQGPAGSPGSNGSPGPPGPSGTITNTSYQMTALGVGTAAGPTGQIRATSNITAYYSDSRLKDFEGPIDSALDKVKALTGYYFKENDLARSFGYDNEERQVGVSAQEVESVLPEVVTEAPFNSDYKSVWYDKLVPLLIEAIKELDDKKKDK